MSGKRAVIAGIGHTEFSQNSGRSTMQLAAEASLASIRDAGFSPNEVDGTVTFSMDTNDELALIRSLGVPMLRFCARTRGGEILHWAPPRWRWRCERNGAARCGGRRKWPGRRRSRLSSIQRTFWPSFWSTSASQPRSRLELGQPVQPEYAGQGLFIDLPALHV